MASPLALPPDRPGEMRAIRVHTSRTVNVELPDGGTRDITFTAGTVGYLLFDIPETAKCAVQLINHKGDRLDCKIPRRLIDIGELSSNFAIRQPEIVQSQQVTAISNRRANDPAGRAIRFLWDDVHANRDALSHLGLKVDELSGVLDNASRKRDAIDAVVASFSNQAWTAVNTPGLPIDAFRNVPRITDTSPHISDSQTMIYLRVYIQGDRFATYAGRSSDPIRRHRDHESAIENNTSDVQHYIEARKYPAANRHSLQMMLLAGVDEIVIQMAETTLCCLLGTWNPALMRTSQALLEDEISSGSSRSLNHMVLMSSFGRVSTTALQRANYPMLGGRGCNWSLPLQEEGTHKRREWIRYRVQTADRRSMLVHRWQSYVSNVENADKLGLLVKFGTSYASSTSSTTPKGFGLTHVLGHLPGIQKGIPLVVSVEIMEDGKPHSMPWYRGPVHGAWDNCQELHSFAVKVEWRDQNTNQWYTYPIQPHKPISVYKQTSGDSTITNDWRKATSILQFFYNRRYRNPPSYLLAHYRPLIREVVYNHLSQSISFQQVPEVTLDPPAHVSFEHNFRALGKASDSFWPAITVGTKPAPAWFGIDKPISCLLCLQNKNHNRPFVGGCTQRETNFNVAADEPHRDRILQASCRRCWELFRRPCIWIKFGQWSDPGARGIRIPSAYYGAAIAPAYDGPAIPIEAPMTVEMYQQLEANEEEMAALDNGVVDEEE